MGGEGSDAPCDAPPAMHLATHPTTPWLTARGGESDPNPNPNPNPNPDQVGSLPGVGSDKQRKLLALGVETCARSNPTL